jgi:hypothetical protein
VSLASAHRRVRSARGLGAGRLPVCSQWIAWRCALSPQTARDRVRVARRLEELPEVRNAFAKGELTYSKVRALTRIEDIDREAELVELAQNTTASQLDRLVGAYRGVVRVESDAVRVHAERYLHWSVDDDGSLVLRGRLAPDDGAALVAAIEAARDEQLQESLADEAATAVDPTSARNADALLALVESGAAERGERTGGERFQVVVHVDADTLQGSESGRCELEAGSPMARETARRLSCDASVVRILERDGRPLSVGRKTRSIPPALRRALRSRDHGCQFPGCTATRHTDAHHIQHWAHGGETNLDNLVTLCRHHHRVLHEGGFTVERSTHSLVFTAPDGRRLPRVPRPCDECRALKSAPAGAPLQAVFEPMDLDYAVDALIDFAPIRAHDPPVKHLDSCDR